MSLAGDKAKCDFKKDEEIVRGATSVTRLDDFVKLMATNLLTKVAQKRLVTFGLI